MNQKVEHNVISVRRTSNYTADKGIYTDTTKTKKSQRSLKFPPMVMDLLKSYKSEQDEEKVKLGSKWIDYDRLFVKYDVRPMTRMTETLTSMFCSPHAELMRMGLP